MQYQVQIKAQVVRM